MSSKEAFETLKRYEAELLITKQTEVTYDVVTSARYEISKLVERDTPMKVDKVDVTPLAHYYYYCKACHVSQGSSEVDRSHKHFCYNCGQRLDWEEE